MPVESSSTSDDSIVRGTEVLLKYQPSLEHMPWTQGGPLPSCHSPSQGKLREFCPSQGQIFAAAKLLFKRNFFGRLGPQNIIQ